MFKMYDALYISHCINTTPGHCEKKDKCGKDGFLDQNCNCICKDGSSDTCDSTKKHNPSKTAISDIITFLLVIYNKMVIC